MSDPHAQLVTIFPSVGERVLSNLITIVGISACAFCFARRSASLDLFSWRTITSMSWARMCVYLMFIDTWLFLVGSSILLNGVGMSRSTTICGLGIYLCAVSYATSKLFCYLFLTEKVHVVWGKGKHVSRMASPVYKICVGVLCIYIAVFVVMIIGRVAFLREDKTCVIGLEPFASIPLLAYDFGVNILLTGLFLWPLVRSEQRSTRLRQVTVRTLVAAIISLVTSTVNMAILTLMHGHQQGWVCLGACGADVIVNSLAIYWVTEGKSKKNTNIELNNYPNTPNTPKFAVSVGSVTGPASVLGRSRRAAQMDYDSDSEFTDATPVYSQTGSRAAGPVDATVYAGSMERRAPVAGVIHPPPIALTDPPKGKVGRHVKFGQQYATSKTSIVGTIMHGLQKTRGVEVPSPAPEPGTPIRIKVTREVHDEENSESGSTKM
ncbi:hypothetical protein BKA62DRAFT_19649 [Auriculariales sp. MPI-PUGE-AT-0066]|nr:hypothetical protein BKA62DRAFT_19649 [Auriculariales sp. MPI-PUGE-AT-0066]